MLQILLSLLIAQHGPKPKCTAILDRVDVQPKVKIAAALGDTLTIKAILYARCGGQIDGVPVWASSDTTVLKLVPGTGSTANRRTAKATFVGAGTAYAKATYLTKADSMFGSLDTTTAPPPPPISATCGAADDTVAAGAAIQPVIDGHGTGTTILLSPGTYTMQSIVPKTADTLCGFGAVLTGAKVLTGWTASGTNWYVSGQTQQQPVSAKPCGDNPQCNYREDLWVDDSLYWHAASLASIGPGTWYFDYASDRIYIPINPSGHTIETSVTGSAISGAATNVRLIGLTVRRYANDAQVGCVGTSTTGTGWTVDSVEIDGCHGLGIRLTGTDPKIRWGHFHHMGQLGITTAGGTGGLVDGNEVDHNNTVGYKGGWEAGGSKFVKTTNLVIQHNNFHHNYWNAIWADINNTNTVIHDNLVRQNWGSGIFSEISWGATIYNNTVDTNGTHATSAYAEGTGILCSATPDCDIHDNTLHGNKNNQILLLQQDRHLDQSDPRGDHLVRNANVYNNTAWATTGSNGMKGDYQTADFLNTRNNCYHNNTWHFPTGTTKFFNFGVSVTDTVWKTSGCNTGEAISRP